MRTTKPERSLLLTSLLVALCVAVPSRAEARPGRVAEQGLSSRRIARPAPRRTGDRLDPARRRFYLQIMMHGSLNVSRTKVLKRRFMAPRSVRDEQIPRIATQNFRRAARHVLQNHDRMTPSWRTARRLNRMLTRGLVPDDVRGQARFRRDPSRFYRWLSSREARELGRRDPVALAEKVHNRIASLDAFPDGNGRTSRLMADLVLLRHGHAPAYYTRMTDYFARGGPRPPATRTSQVSYFREIARRGDAVTKRWDQLRRAARATMTPPGR